MSVVKFNPVDGLPEWKGRKVVTERQKARVAKRAGRFIMIDWGDLVRGLRILGAGALPGCFSSFGSTVACVKPKRMMAGSTWRIMI